MKIAVCCIFKDENDYIEEWINYHKTIGFDHFIIYDNDSKISPMENLGNFKDIITYTKWPGHYVGRQCRAYDDCIKNNKNYDWIAFIDIDEFIVLLDTKKLNIKEYLKNYEEFDAVALNWLQFGPSGHKTKQKSVIYSYTKACFSAESNKHVKCIVKPSKINQRVGNPHFFPCKTVNVEFNTVNGPFSDPVINKHMRINHYVTRSEEDFKDKIVRGGGNAIRSLPISTLDNYKDGNTKKDTSIIDLYNLIK